MTDLMFVDFLNSHMYDGHGNAKDRITDPGWIGAFRSKWGFDGEASTNGSDPDAYFRARRQPDPTPAGPGSPRWDPAALDDLLELRALLRVMVGAVANGDAPKPAQVRKLDAFLAGAAIRHEMRSTSEGLFMEQVPLAEGHRRITGEIALSAARFLTSGERDRLKMCTNPGCRWIYYDGTKNRSRRWCNSALCGNLFKVRRYRSRQREAER